MADNPTNPYAVKVERSREQNHMTYYKLDKETGEIIECPRLPADAVFFKRYLARGMTIDRASLEEQSARIKTRLQGGVIETNPMEAVDPEMVSATPTVMMNVSPPGNMKCDVCGKPMKNLAGLKSHKRIKHNH